MGTMRCWMAACVLAHAAVCQAASAAFMVPPNLAGPPGGSLAAHGSVTTQGSAQLTIPLLLPPGTAGMAPVVSLDYDSQDGMGNAGLGWGAGAFAAVHRCAQTTARDGRNTAVDLSAADAYCLGDDRLIRISGVNGGKAEYRSEIEPFSRIRSFGDRPDLGPQRWVVESREGRIREYGVTDDSVWRSGDRRVRWYLARERDRHGNNMRFDYDADPAGAGERFLRRIAYTGNEAAGLAPYAHVDFIYESRPDADDGWLADVPYASTRRLASIETHLDEQDGARDVLERRWTLAYETSPTSGRSLLRSVTTCGGDGMCLPPTQFDYTGRDPAHATLDAPGSGAWGGPPVALSGQPSAGTPRSQLDRHVLVADIDGDGRKGLVVSTGDGRWDACRSTGRHFACASLQHMPAVDSEAFLAGDFDQDGRDDVLIPAPRGRRDGWQLCLSRSAGFECTAFRTPVPSPGRDPANYILGDFTGNGRSGVLILDARHGHSTLCPWTGTRLGPCRPFDTAGVRYAQAPSDGSSGRPRWLLADFNGDGRLDVLQWNADPAHEQTTLQLYLANDHGLVAAGPPAHARGAMQEQDGGVRLADLNGDGVADLVFGAHVHGPDGLRGVLEACRVSIAGTACRATDVDDPSPFVQAGDVNYYDGTRGITARTPAGIFHLDSRGLPRDVETWAPPHAGMSADCLQADVDGDGKPDLACYDRATRAWTVSLVGSGDNPDLLREAVDGGGFAMRFDYATHDDPTVYERGQGTRFPQMDKVQAWPTLVRTFTSGAVGELATRPYSKTDYRYGGDRRDVERRNALGFEWVTSEEHVAGVTTLTPLSQRFPTIGQPTGLARRGVGGRVLHERIDDWAAIGQFDKVRHPYVRRSCITAPAGERSCDEIGDAADPGIDRFGNVTRRFTGTAPHRVRKDTVFDDSEDDWRLGIAVDERSFREVNDGWRPTGRVVTRHDDFGAVVERDEFDADGAPTATSTWRFDPVFGVQLGESHGLAGASGAQTSEYRYDGEPRRRFPTSIVHGDGTTDIQRLDERNGNFVEQALPGGHRLRQSFDSLGRGARRDLEDGTWVTWSYHRCIDACDYAGNATTVSVGEHWGIVDGKTMRVSQPLEEFLDGRGVELTRRAWDDDGQVIWQDATTPSP